MAPAFGHGYHVILAVGVFTFGAGIEGIFAEVLQLVIRTSFAWRFPGNNPIPAALCAHHPEVGPARNIGCRIDFVPDAILATGTNVQAPFFDEIKCIAHTIACLFRRPLIGAVSEYPPSRPVVKGNFQTIERQFCGRRRSRLPTPWSITRISAFSGSNAMPKHKTFNALKK